MGASWKIGRLEDWKIGRLEDWKIGLERGSFGVLFVVFMEELYTKCTYFVKGRRGIRWPIGADFGGRVYN